jgi:hypothetical protein
MVLRGERGWIERAAPPIHRVRLGSGAVKTGEGHNETNRALRETLRFNLLPITALRLDGSGSLVDVGLVGEPHNLPLQPSASSRAAADPAVRYADLLIPGVPSLWI